MIARTPILSLRWLSAMASLVLLTVANAASVEFQLVPFDDPKTTVDKLEKERPILNPISTPKGVEMKKIGIDYTGWARNVLLDGKPIFERYFEGKYIDRLPIAKADLKPGDHTIWPGNHVFTVGKDGAITTKSSELIIENGVVKIKTYPVTLRAYLANPPEADLPMTMRVTPLPNLTLRDAGEADQDKAKELLPVFDKFAPLTLWLPANTDGKGYLVHPVGLTFQLNADGVKPGAGEGQSIAGLQVKENVIEIPVNTYPIIGDLNTKVVITGVEQLLWRGAEGGEIKPLTLYPRAEPFEILITKPGPALALSTATYPFKSFRVEMADPASGSQRAIVTELTERHFAPGGKLTARVRAIDATPANMANVETNKAKTALAIAERDFKAAQAAAAEAEKALKAAQTKESEAVAATTGLEGGDLEDAKRVEAEARQKAADANQAFQIANAALAPAEKLTQTARAALEAATQKVEATATENPLEKAAPFAQLQLYGSEEWIDLKTQADADHQITLELPTTGTGVYKLRLGVRGETGPPLSADQWISITTPEPLGIGLFTQRGRDAFFRGESFWVGLAALAKTPLPAGETLELDLVDAQNIRLPLLREKIPAVEKQRTFIVRLDGAQTLSLAAGKYRIEAKVGAKAATPFSIQIIEPEPSTHFTTLLNGKYNVLSTGKNGLNYSTVVKTGRGAEELAAEITALGYNTFMGMNYEMSRIHRRGLDLEQVVRERPELGPWESFYQPSGRDRFLNAAVRHNLRFYENIFSQHDAMLPRDPQILDACERYIGLEVASMRFSPAFKGVCLYDELYDTGDNDAPRSVVASFFKGQEMAYREKYPGMTSADATKAFDRFTSRPVGQRKVEDLEKFRSWAAHQDSDWKTFSDRMAGAAKDIAPETKNWTLYRAWGSNGGSIATNGTTDNVFASLDIASVVMYKDGGSGDRPVFAPMLADVLRVRDDIPVWTQIHNYHASGLYGGHLMRQAIFGLSQKIEGLSFFTIEHDPMNPEVFDNRDSVRNIAGAMLTPYGDFFTSLDRGYRKVAVFYSRESAQLAARKPNDLNYTAEGLWVACIRAGFPADFLYDRQLIAGKGAEYEVIFAPGYYYEDEASPEVLAALNKLVAAGKIVVVEKSSKLPIEGIFRLPSDIDEYDDKLGGAFPRYVDHETATVWYGSEEITKVVREFLSKKIKPAAIHDLIVGPDWLKAGQGEYLVLPNFAPTEFTGLHKTLYQAPDMPTLRFPARSTHVYDVFEMKPVEVKKDGEWMTLQADLRVLPGKVYAFLPATIEKVVLKATPQLTAGTDLNFQASVAGPDGQTVDAAFPIEITITDASGKVWLNVFRAARPVFEMAWRVPINASAGAWKLRVRELISGTVAESTLNVTAASNPSLAGKLDTQAVWIHEPEHIQKFINDKPPEGTPEIVIAIDAEQPWVRPHAEKLVAELKAKGRTARIAPVSEVVRVVNEWGETPVLDGGRLWRGELVDPGLFVDAPLILLGRRYENRLIEALARRDVLPEVISANFPGSGKAVIGWTRRGFSNFYNTVTVLANDDAGLAAGIAALPNVTGKTELPKLTQAAFTANSKLEPGASLPKLPTPLRDALSGEDRVRSVDVDPTTGRVIVGTFGFGDNLFCFSAEGKLLWKQFLPEHNVYFARWIDGGKKIVAATGQGFFLFLLNGETGSVLKKLASTERPRFHESYNLPNLEGAKNTELQIEINDPLRQILVRGLTGIMAINFDGQKMWFHDRSEAIAGYPKEAEQSVAASFGNMVHVGNFSLSPDGNRLIYSEEFIFGATPGEKPGTKDELWKHTPKILDAKTGQVLSQNEEDPGTQRSSGAWSVNWPGNSPLPRVETQGLSATLREDNTLGPFLPDSGTLMKDGGKLISSPTSLERFDAAGKTQWSVAESRIWLPELDAVNADQSRLYRSDRDGLIRCFDLATGKTLWDFKMPFNSELRPFGNELIAGANNGTLVRLNAEGKPLWQTRLRDHHEIADQDYPEYLAAARLRDVDSTGEFFPIGKDGPDDYQKTLRMGIEQLANGDFESAESWKSEQGALTLGEPFKTGKSALQLSPGQLVTQRPTPRVIPSATYLLEFWYRVDDAKTNLVAGTLLDGAKQTFTGSKFSGRPGDWTFGRLAIKTSAGTKSLDVGFEAAGGKVSVDSASLRAVRFPSANLLANAELNAVEQSFVKDIRVQFERIPSTLRERLMSRNRVSAFAQGITSTAMIYTQEAAFLQNGKLDDVGSIWTNAPDPMAFAVTLTKPSYVSHLVIYLNNANPKEVYPMISILANNLQTKTPEEAALVRMNERRFIVVNFPTPLFTDALKIIPSFYSSHTDSITEVEVYGPLDGGKVAKELPKDPDAMPMLMNTATRVPTQLPADLIGTWKDFYNFRNEKFPAFASGTTVVDGVFSVADPAGAIRSVVLPRADQIPPKRAPQLLPGPQWNLATVTPTTTPARYAGRLLVGSADSKLHAVADNGTYLWSFATGGRIYSSPVPQGDDVFFGSDDANLYKVDVDSGILIWEFKTGDKVRGAPALADGKVFVASWDGFLYAVDSETGQFVWKSPIAKFTRSTPAIQGDRIFLGDESGTMRAFDLKTGRELWKQALGGYISACPVVTPAGIAFASEQGDLAFVGADGNIKWKRALGSGVSGQPIATQTQLLIPTEKGLMVLRQSDGQPDSRFIGPDVPHKILSVAKWRNQLFLNVGYAWTDFRWPPRTYVETENQTMIWVPEANAPHTEVNQ